jgi:hypothetical protein
MAVPATSVDTLWRNNIDDVARFMETYHAGALQCLFVFRESVLFLWLTFVDSSLCRTLFNFQLDRELI